MNFFLNSLKIPVIMAIKNAPNNSIIIPFKISLKFKITPPIEVIIIQISTERKNKDECKKGNNIKLG